MGHYFSLNISEICGFHISFITSAPPFWSFAYFWEDFARKSNDKSSCNDRLWTTPSIRDLESDIVKHGLLSIKYLTWLWVFCSSSIASRSVC